MIGTRRNDPGAPFAWVTLLCGIGGILISLIYPSIQPGQNFLWFTMQELLIWGIIYVIVALLLLLVFRPRPAQAASMTTTRPQSVATPNKAAEAESISFRASGIAVGDILSKDRREITVIPRSGAIASVHYALDGVELARETIAPYRFHIDPAALTPGKHTLEVAAFNPSGKMARQSFEFSVGMPDTSGTAAHTAAASVATAGATLVQSVKAAPDDLLIIEGIGPKVKDALTRAGITTFAQVAGMTPDELHRVVKIEAGVKIVDGATRSWPQQARLLAEGRLAEFKRLVDDLRGGFERKSDNK